jgi:hypothetical protein
MNHTPPSQAPSQHTHPLVQDPHLTGIAPRWSISIGILLTGIIYLVLDSRLKIGPDWALLAIELALIVPMWIIWVTGHTLSYSTTRLISFILLGCVTAGLVIAVSFLIHDLTHFKRGFTLLQTAGLLWVFNVLVFALSGTGIPIVEDHASGMRPTTRL